MIAGIILAAGSSSRLGRPKQLLPLQGKPLLRVTVERVLTTNLDVVYVVLGHHADRIASAIQDLPVRLVINPDATQGQSTSVLAGLRAVAAVNPEAVMFLLGDQPGIEPSVVNAIIARWRETHARVVAPTYANGIGNPVLFDRSVLPEFSTLHGDVGARQIVQAYRERGEIDRIPVDFSAPRDVDTDADYDALLTSFDTDQQETVPCIDWCSDPD